MKKYSLSAIGKDRPGIVAGLTAPLYARGCNIEDSSMTILEGEFAVILIMSVPGGADLTALTGEMDETGKKLSLTINMKEIDSEKVTKKNLLSNYIITLHGEDNTGIVHKTAKLLAEEGINITDLETKSARKEGDKGAAAKQLYMMMMEVHLADNTDVKRLRNRLTALGHELGLSVSMKPIEDYGRL